MRPDVAVRNASDAKQVERARKADEHRRMQRRLDLQSILSTVQGRRFLWEWISVLQPKKAFPNGMWQGSALMQFNAARYDVGTDLINEIEEADDSILLLMAQEARDRKRVETASRREAQQNPDRASDSE